MPDDSESKTEKLPAVVDDEIIREGAAGKSCWEIARKAGLPVEAISRQMVFGLKEQAKIIEEAERLRFKMHGPSRMWDIMNNPESEDRDKVAAYGALSKEYSYRYIKSKNGGVTVNIFEQVIRDAAGGKTDDGKVIDAVSFPGIDDDGD